MDVTGDELLWIFRVISGVLIFALSRVLIAWIRKDKDKLVELRQNPDGTKQLTIKGYSQKDQSKIVQQFSRKSAANLPAGVSRTNMSTLSN